MNMPYVAFVLRQQAGALRQLLAAEAVVLLQTDDPLAKMRVAQLRSAADG